MPADQFEIADAPIYIDPPIDGAYKRINCYWLDHNVRDLFPTDSAWSWFKRNHGLEMAESGEYISRGRRGGDFAGPNLRAVVLDILKRETIQAWSA
jgi:hypothetical protein